MIAHTMIARLRPLLVPAIVTLLATAILCGLGIWQLHRLAWKEGILAEIGARAKAPPQAVPARADWGALKPSAYEYRHVKLAGTFDNAKETLVFRASEDGPGYLVMTPLTLADGSTIVVDRGWVPADLRDRADRAAGEPRGPVEITGLMREPEPRNLFTPADDLATGQFFTRDPATIAAYRGLSDVAPFTIDADATPNPGGWPRGGATALNIPNNHFEYAMTWFGLALALLCVFTSMAWKRLHEAPNGASAPRSSGGAPASLPP